MFLTSEKSFTDLVFNSSQAVLVHFRAPWCGLCKMLDPFITTAIQGKKEQITLVEINADENLKLANIYQLKSLPTLILFHQGQVIDRLDRFTERDQILPNLQTMLNRFHGS